MKTPELRTNILLFGPSRSGKTYLTSKFVELGVNAFDAEAENLCHWTNDSTGEVVAYPEIPTQNWLQHNHFKISKDALVDFLKDREPLILLGHAWNIMDCIDQFDKSYFLYVPPLELERRLAINRNPEKTRIIKPAVLDFHRERHAERLAQARKRAIPVLDTTIPSTQNLVTILANQ